MNKQSLLNLVHSFNTPRFARAGEVDDAERQPWCRRVVYHLPPDESALGNEGSKVDLRKLVGRPNAIPERGERLPASAHQLKLESFMRPHAVRRSFILGHVVRPAADRKSVV